MVKSRSLTTAQCRLVNPYVQPVLYIRRPGSDIEEMHRFPDDDPFFSEVSLLAPRLQLPGADHGQTT